MIILYTSNINGLKIVYKYKNNYKNYIKLNKIMKADVNYNNYIIIIIMH